MAQMFPKFLGEGVNPDEKIVFEELAKMPDDWMVFHNVWEFYDEDDVYDRRSGTQKRVYLNFEADFVVLVPGLGMAVIEVKGAHDIRIQNGVWKFKPHGKTELQEFSPDKVSPLHQAYLAAKKLCWCLNQHGTFLPGPPVSRYPMEYTCLAVLTNCAPPESAEPCMQDCYDVAPGGKNKKPAGREDVRKRYIYGLAELRSSLRAKIEGAFYYRNDNLTREHMESIRADLCANYRFRRDRSSYENELMTAGATVNGLLATLQNSTAHMRIDGCAGSGKTVMLCQEVCRLCEKATEEGTPVRILVLCYNEWLYERKLAGAFAGVNMVQSGTFFSFCRKILRSYGMPVGTTGELSPTEVQCLIHHFQTAERYDYVFIDEAQDFAASSWWKIIMAMPKPADRLHGRMDKGRIIAFCDKNQILYGTRDCVPPFPIRITLDHNLRNSRQVADYSSGLLPEGERPKALDLCGEEVHVLPACDTVEGRRDAVLKCVADILQGDAAMPVKAEDIVVLSPYVKDGRSVLPALVGMLPPGVTACSIKKFKGLESLYVILTDIPAPGQRGFTQNDFYVACTRAKFGLIIIPTVEGARFAQEILQNSPETNS